MVRQMGMPSDVAENKRSGQDLKVGGRKKDPSRRGSCGEIGRFANDQGRLHSDQVRERQRGQVCH